jgi:hypothetical protein
VKRLIETVKLMTLPYTHTSYEQEYFSTKPLGFSGIGAEFPGH